MSALRLPSPRRMALLAVLVPALLAAMLLGAASASAAAGSWWHLTSATAPAKLAPGAEGQIDVSASNLGYEDIGASAEAPIVITDTVPAGLEVLSGVRGYALTGARSAGTALKECSVVGQVVKCPLTRRVAAYEGLELIIPVKVAANPGSPVNAVKIEGGESGPTAEAHEAVNVTGASTPFAIERYALVPENSSGQEETQGGAHPFQLTTTLNLDQTRELNNLSKQQEETTPSLVRDLHFVLPPGMLGNVTLVPQCTSLQFATVVTGDSNECKEETAVGVARVKINEPNINHGVDTESVPVFNLVPENGEPARFGIEIDKVPVILNTAVRTGSDYAVEVTVSNSTQAATLIDSQVTFWGVPGDERHDHSRGWQCLGDEHWDQGFEPPRPCRLLKEKEPKAFLTLPTSCSGTPTTSVTGDSWPVGSSHEVRPLSSSYTFPTAFTRCELLGFTPALRTKPDTQRASTPSGLTVEVEVDQKTTLAGEGLAASDIKDTTVTFPEGFQASPGAANGLLSCSAGSAGLVGGVAEGEQLQNDHFTPAEASCPEASKIGSVSIKTPLLKDELKGWVYLASQDTNPFASPLVLYVMAFDPVSGVRVKLAGEVRLDPSTGRLTSEFKNTPPVPFEVLTLHLFDGSRASQSTPPLCGTHETRASFVPSSGGATENVGASFSITEGANGGPCENSYPQSFAPSLQAGSLSQQAGSYSEFSLTINHSDADQPLSGVTVHLPEGMAAMLSHVTPCAEPPSGVEWACGPESLIGEATTSSGLGSSPYTLKGAVYITSGYDGAPFGLLVATHAKAGPFDLGMINVRSRINVDPSTAAVTITTDPGPRGEVFPTILKGVPVQLKTINVLVNRPEFQFNPTNCSAAAVTGTLAGSQGSSAAVSYPFNPANCASLPFAPKLTATAGGQASKRNGASLNVKVQSAGFGQANIAKVDLTLPIALPSRLSTIQKACLLAVFNTNPATCDEGSNIGYAIIHTPVLRSPLTGPAYLVSHGGAAFPDVEFVLQGEGITLVLDGKTDIKKGITYSRFESTPDAPFSVFETFLPTGPHSALTAYVPASKNYSLCGANLVMPTEITAQNGAVIKQTTPIVATGCKATVVHKLTRAQKLAKALKVCKKYKSKSKLAACKAKARKQYGAKKSTKKKASSRRK
ncbi:MAG: hypothetical protein ACYDHN_01100 [Solirubrobacteraceae bacterium]